VIFFYRVLGLNGRKNGGREKMGIEKDEERGGIVSFPMLLLLLLLLACSSSWSSSCLKGVQGSSSS